MLRAVAKDLVALGKNVKKVMAVGFSGGNFPWKTVIFGFFILDKLAIYKKLCNSRSDIRSESSEYFCLGAEYTTDAILCKMQFYLAVVE